MKKTILIVGVFLAAIVGCFFWFSQGEDVVHDQPSTLKIQGKMDKSDAIPLLDTINARNAQVKNFSCDLKAIAQMPGRRAAKLNGYLNYEKERKFRLELDSFLGPELDIGSDGKQFWFWSGRMQNPGLYWSTYENFDKTRLKTPFNPLWLSHCLGIDIINYKNSTVDKNGERWRVITKTLNAKKEPVTAVIYVDPKRALITGHGMYSEAGVLEASSEIQSFNGSLPTKITFIWHKENASMVWNLNNVRANVGIDSRKWEMPNITPKIDMSRE